MLVTALGQSIRSLLITLIPAGIITFLAWAIAGSEFASTTDPFRAGLWVFLGAHLVPFDLHLPPSGIAGWLTYLPLGAITLPAIALSIGAKRCEAREPGGTKWLFALIYSAFSTLIALFSANNDVAAMWYWTLPVVLLFSLFVTFLSSLQINFSHALIYLAKIWALLLGFSGITLGISLLINLNTVHQLTTVLAPGWVGGILLLALNILYLPNFFISVLAYFAGTGFAVGIGTLISPLHFEIGKIPALPILGALPTGRHPLFLIGGVFIIGVGVAVGYWTLDSGRLILRQTMLLFVISTFVVAYFGSGALITHEMGSIGPSMWKFPIALSLEFLLGVGLTRIAPLITRR